MRTIAIIGIGGVGSWVTYQTVKENLVDKIILIDEDFVEERNLHRTPYTQKHIGKKKVDAITEIVKEINTEIAILKYPIMYNETFPLPDMDILVNTTDNTKMHTILPKIAEKEGYWYIRGSYNGNHYTIDWRTRHRSWGHEEREQYPLTPKIWTAQIVASHVVYLIDLFLSEDVERGKELDIINSKYEKIYSAEIFEIF